MDIVKVLDEELYDCSIGEIKRNDKWFYHGMNFENSNVMEKLDSVFNKGLLCSALRRTYSGGWNGNYYISLAKSPKERNSDSCYYGYTNYKLALIIDKVHPLYANPDRRLYAMDSPIPIRRSEWDDEYHKFLRVKPKSFIGIQYPFWNYKGDSNLTKYSMEYLLCVLEYILMYDENFPFYSFHQTDNELLLMDKEKTRKLFQSKIN